MYPHDRHQYHRQRDRGAAMSRAQGYLLLSLSCLLGLAGISWALDISPATICRLQQLNVLCGPRTASGVSTGNFNTCVGEGACANLTTEIDHVAVGRNATASAASGSGNVMLGTSTAILGAGTGFSIALGESAQCTASNQWVVGSAALSQGITDAYLGQGVQAEAANSPAPGITLHASGSTGTNKTGGPLILAGGIGTGSGAGGDIIWATAAAGGAGSGLNSLSNRWKVTGADGHLLAITDNTYDIGANGATRPRTVYAGTSVVAPAFTGALTGNASTATALAANPADCGANTFAQSIDASGTLTCAGVSLSTADTTGTLTVTKGGNGAAPGADDQVAVSDSSSAATWRSLPNCTDSTGNHLNYTAATNTFSCGTSSGAGAVGGLHFDVRMTLTSGTPVTSADVTGATTVYVTPYKGNYISLYDGVSAWNTITFSEVSVALGTITSGLPYDVFCYNNSGVLACDAPLAWTNGTTRATAITLQNGVYVKSGATTRLYIGTFYTTATTTTEDSVAKRYVWNYYNRRPRWLTRFESTASWTYATATYRQANASASNQVELVVGLLEDLVQIDLHTATNNSGAANGIVAIGEDSTTTPVANSVIGIEGTSAVAFVTQVQALFSGYPSSVGRHYYAWLERPQTATTSTFYGAGGTSPEVYRYGLTGWVWG